MPDQKPPEELKVIQIPEILPILPLFNILVFPKMMLPMEVFGEQSINLVDEAMAKDRIIGLILAKKSPLETNYRAEDFHSVGTTAVILKMAKVSDKKAQLLVQGIGRFRIVEFLDSQPYLHARIEPLEDTEIKDIEVEALMVNLTTLFERVVKLTPFLPQEFGAMAKSVTDPGVLADLIASIINVSVEEKQTILETLDVKERLREVTRLVNHQVEILELGNKIQSQVKDDMEKSQREYYLRQQLNAIRKELGESDETRVEIEEYRAKLAAKDLPEEARKEAERELARLERMHPSSAEYTVSSTYLDWILALPWREGTEDNLDIKKARRVLDEDHWGLEKPKKRIIEYLAVRKLKPDTRGPILCFVGPPGTGKTSLGQSIARALGRKFVRIALGGVRDEAEIRGHRRTYIGALPGRIIQGIRRAESNNPVFMLDEIDKVGSDFRGDPSSALLEVLDPAQNNSFVDHYLDLAFDLSHVMFITTANILDTIPPALRDRLEIIELVSYTSEEKLHIARRYLIPRQIAENGLTPDLISFTKGAVQAIISGYTREAGVRNLEREIAAVCRGVASAVAEGARGKHVIRRKDIPRYLGPVRTFQETAARTSKPGVVMGLAWTPTGGDLLFIEATAMPGKKGLTLTGQLGDVMKESASAALSFIRANTEALGLAADFFENLDIHIHVPSGAIPKDGPSAGVTILAALTSLLKNKPVKKDLAMTGEITLRGLVLPVGGIKEKVLAAHRAGIKTVILPRWNRKDMEDIPPKIRKDIEFIFVDEMMEVLKGSGLL
ncbi:MAG TPA: endopeptidase La [Syntrophales bacterium]|nr:endopeptidase La [Syntrophales bacterium]HOM07491.1 endopeptidase La [Syntrophales bacterium]HOO00026.1 endopeptidase La [Syntrophales bacterium]HPC00860.1 endopeptidase La [Syntrophales bacterium]HPQ07110.1 endopeptidase La [Syntrophales bacterium]